MNLNDLHSGKNARINIDYEYVSLPAQVLTSGFAQKPLVYIKHFGVSTLNALSSSQLKNF